jgi:hypothetical protein
VPGFFADDSAAAVAGSETADEADLDRGSVDVAPRQPKAVRVAKLAVAVVFFHVLWREDVLAVGDRVGRFAAGLIEGIDLDRAFYFDGLLLVGPIEPNAAAKTAHGHRAVMVEHSVLPDSDDLHGAREPAVCARTPGNVLRQIKASASAGCR